VWSAASTACSKRDQASGSEGGILSDTLRAPKAAPEEFYTTLGRFISTFAAVEGALYVLLVKTSNVPPAMARAVFTDARIDNAKKAINRLRTAQGLPENAMLTRAFLQLSEIAKMRNDLFHYGERYSEEHDAIIVTNEKFVHTKANIRRSAISADILSDMIHDLLAIQIALGAMWFEGDEAAPDLSGIERLPWRYKWRAPSRARNEGRDSPPKRTPPPKPSRQ